MIHDTHIRICTALMVLLSLHYVHYINLAPNTQSNTNIRYETMRVMIMSPPTEYYANY